MQNFKIWDKRDQNRYSLCRIPGIIITSSGTLIIYNEARESRSDWAMMDIFCRRSTDGGKTFSAPIYLAKGSAEHPTVNNPVMAEGQNGVIHFLYCEDYGTRGGRVLHRTSEDDGISWSTPIDISNSTLTDMRNVFALGPGHGICTRSGRLIFPFWLVPKKFGAPVNAHIPSEVGILYSDDGVSWHTSSLLTNCAEILSPNETVAAELEDGSIYLAIRHNAYYRACALTRDCINFESYTPEFDLRDPICFGSAVSVGDTLFFVNCDNTGQRQNITLKASKDGGKTWLAPFIIDENRGGYADIAADKNNGKLYVLYENNFGEELYLAVIDEAFKHN